MRATVGRGRTKKKNCDTQKKDTKGKKREGIKKKQKPRQGKIRFDNTVPTTMKGGGNLPQLTGTVIS